MKPERWQQIKASLNDALQLESSDRAAFLDRVHREDPELHSELLSLIGAAERADESFLDTAALAGSGEHGDKSSPRIGLRVGPYRLEELIGSGGMGEVYRAVRVDAEFNMRVAIKLIPAGRDTVFVVNRFKAERRILAGLEHPNIARLLDGGSTDDGMPYFVMEFVEGQAIGQYCEERRLGVESRLHLFLQVCGAVQYAHQRLVIHRDLKPSNILVGADGAPKLLDFGIAKIFDPVQADTGRPQTITVLRQMTPDYASPEQIRGQSITTVSDVYSLGVILYELLSGRRPHSSIAAKARNSLPPTGDEIPPIAAGRQDWRRARGDLNIIVRMALRTDPARRYASVEQFAEDIRRYLSSRPIVARPDSWRYRASQFVRRYTAGVVAGVIVLCAIIIALSVVAHQSQIARVARWRAEQRFNDVRQLAHALIFDLHDAIQDLSGGTAARHQLVLTALRYLDSLSRESGNEPSLQLELAEAYSRLGDIQGRPLSASESDPAGAIQSYQHALALRMAVLKERPQEAAVRAAAVGSLVQLSELLWLARNAQEALDDAKQAVAYGQGLLDEDPTNEDYQGLLARSLLASGYLQYKIKGEAVEALQSLGKSVELLKSAWEKHPDDPSLGRQLSLAYTRSGELLGAQPQGLDKAIAMASDAREVLKSLVARAPHNADFRHLLAFADFGAAANLITAQRVDEARRREQMALDEIKALSAEDPKIVEYHADVAFVTGNMARIANLQGDYSRAIVLAHEGMVEMAPISADRNGYFGYVNVVLREDLGAAYAGLGGAARDRQQRVQDWRAALNWYEQAYALLNALSSQSQEAKAEAALVAQRRDHCAAELKGLGSAD